MSSCDLASLDVDDADRHIAVTSVHGIEEEYGDALAAIYDESFVGTTFHLVGSNELGHVPGFQEALGRLWLVLKGCGLMKTRHVPVDLSDVTQTDSEQPDRTTPSCRADGSECHLRRLGKGGLALGPTQTPMRRGGVNLGLAKLTAVRPRLSVGLDRMEG